MLVSLMDFAPNGPSLREFFPALRYHSNLMRLQLLPAIIGASIPLSDEDRSIFFLPTAMGALSISNPVITTLILVQLLRRFVRY
jgi:hypothetical protein